MAPKFFYWAFCAPSFLLVISSVCHCDRSWPVPPKTYTDRPVPNTYCQAGVIPFCPTGLPANRMPKFPPNDTLYVYAMKAPVWEFKFGDLLGKFHIMHDAVGFHHVQSGLNITMEWYELFQLFNCTFPHELQDKSLLWCNEGATCIYPGIDERHWRQNGTLVKVSEISGDIFNRFGDWVEQDNATHPIYETWTVMDAKEGNYWFNPIDCASWVIRAFDKIKDLGGTFDSNVHLNYTKIILYSEKPQLIGTYDQIFNNVSMVHYKEQLLTFYEHFHKESNYYDLIFHMLEAIYDFLVDDSFFLYYNDLYWKLPLKSPHIELTYNENPLPL